MTKITKAIMARAEEFYLRTYFRWGLPARGFIQVNIETNSICTRRCHYCIFGIKDVPVKKMPDALFFKIIDELRDMKFSGRLSLFELNEPLTDKRIYDFTRYAHIVLPKAYQLLVTNGDLLSIERLDMLMSAGLEHLMINSYDEPSKIRNMEFISYASDKYPGRVEHNDRTNFTEWESRASHIEQYKKDPVDDLCEYPNYILYIKPDGRVLGCWNDFDVENVMGDLTSKTIKEVWFGQRFREFRYKVNRGKRKGASPCNGCDHRPNIDYIRWIISLPAMKNSNKSFDKCTMNEAESIKNRYLKS